MLRINETMAPDDHMLTSDVTSYLRISRGALDCVLNSLSEVGRPPETIRSVLDFGSGYGRVYRALAAQFPHAVRTAVDLMAPAAKFCAETFGGDWVKSEEDLTLVNLPRKYDLIWLGSVFTHLPEHRWHSLLDFLADNTEQEGIVVFTSHGERAIKQIEDVVLKRNPYLIDARWFVDMKQTLPRVGFAFIADASGTYRHQVARGMDVTQGEYGFSFATREWVERLVAEKAEWEMVDYKAPGWAGKHDAVTLRRR